MSVELIFAGADALADPWELTPETAWGLIENSIAEILDIDLLPPPLTQEEINELLAKGMSLEDIQEKYLHGMTLEEAQEQYSKYLGEQIFSIQKGIESLIEDIQLSVDNGTLKETPEIKALVSKLSALHSRLGVLESELAHRNPDVSIERLCQTYRNTIMRELNGVSLKPKTDAMATV